MSIRDYNPPVSPTPETVSLAKRAVDELGRPGARFALVDRASGREVPLGDQVHGLLKQLLADLACDRPVAIMPLAHELTPNQAADILNVSRGYVIRRIEAGEIPARMVGSHYRIGLEELLVYKVRSDAEYERNMLEMVKLEQELGLE